MTTLRRAPPRQAPRSAAALAALAALALAAPAGTAGEAPPVRAPATEPEEEMLVRGPLRPQFTATLGPVIDGIVRSLEVREGERVRRGAVLLRLDDDVEQARIGLARASAEAQGELHQAQAQAQEAASLHARMEAALGSRAVSDWELRQARSRLDAARAAVEAAEDRHRVELRKLDLERAMLDQHVIRAPFDGVVTKVETAPGAALSRTDRPLAVADLSVLEAMLYVPAALWSQLRPGASYTLRLGAPAGRSVRATLRHVDPVMDAASGRFRAIFVIGNADYVLPAGIEAILALDEVER